MLQAISEVMGVEVADIVSEKTNTKLFLCRCIFVYFFHRKNLTHVQIGEMINRKHSSVTYMLQRLNELEKDFDFYHDLKAVKDKLQMLSK